MDNLAEITVPSDFDTDSVRVTLLGQLSTFLSPLGTKENPAMSCQDIYTCNDNFKPGYYWIDPNEGSPKDAVRVFCRGTETCLSPSKDNSQFEYPEGDIPLRFLRLKHTHVRQNITYNCEGGVDGFTLMKLQGANGDTIQFGDKTIRMVSQPGECPVVLEVTTEEGVSSNALPVKAVLPEAHSRPQSYSAGPVCFW